MRRLALPCMNTWKIWSTTQGSTTGQTSVSGVRKCVHAWPTAGLRGRVYMRLIACRLGTAMPPLRSNGPWKRQDKTTCILPTRRSIKIGLQKQDPHARPTSRANARSGDIMSLTDKDTCTYARTVPSQRRPSIHTLNTNAGPSALISRGLEIKYRTPTQLHI